MRKLLVSVGLVAAGTASLGAATYAPGLSSMEATKLWSLSGTLRGFYDDNYTTSSSGGRKGSFGFEVTPSFSLNVPLQQTEIGLRYTYGLYYYQEREDLGQRPIDQTHQLDLWLDHAFTERWQAKVQDSFVVAQEPQLVDPTLAVPNRVEGNNIRNTGTIALNTEWTQLLSTALTYQNSFFDYQNSGGTAATPSLSGLLDRIEQLVSLDFQWRIQPETTAFVGYQYGQVNYIGNEPVGAGITFTYFSNSRDNRSQYVYVGAQHAFTANLSVSAKGGIQYVQEYNDPAGNTSSLSPYVDLSATYTYIPGSYVQVGFTQQRNATDVIAQQNTTGGITLDQESSVVYASINHQLTSKLLASVVGQWQYSIFNGGAFNNQADTDYTLGVNLSYNFTQHLSAEAGYNFDELSSNIAGRSYSRNRGYLGVTATY